MLKMDLEYHNGILYVRLKGTLTRNNNYKINNYIVPVLIKHKIKYLIYNFEYLTRIDESSIDAILNTKCKIRNNKGIVYICNASESISTKIKRLRIKQIGDEKTAEKLLKVEINWTMKK